MTNDIMIPDIDTTDIKWADIVDRMTDVILTDNTDTPENVIRAAELTLAGFPKHEIAKKLSVSVRTVRNWFKKYPMVSFAIAEARKDLSLWRMQLLEKQLLLAMDKSQEVLTLDPKKTDDINVKLVGVQAQHARYIMSLFFGNKLDVNVHITHDTPTLKASQEALDYLLARIEAEENTIEGVVRIIDEKDDKSGPILDEEGNPHHGELGVLDIEDGKMLCHVCGNRYERLDIHIRTKEDMSDETYETLFMLPSGIIKDTVNAELDRREAEKDRASD